MTALIGVSSLGLTGCAAPNDGEVPSDWWQEGDDFDVIEHVEFTDQPYDFTGQTPIGDLVDPNDFSVVFGSDEDLQVGQCDGWSTTDNLPVEITGIVTIHPRLYSKKSGCDPISTDRVYPSDEKYYGSYFIEDASGGMFVLGDTKVAHFDHGDRVTLKVRAVKKEFGTQMISTHDVVRVEPGPEPISFKMASGVLDEETTGEVYRVSGRVITEQDTFGQLQIEAADGTIYDLSVDSELSRRGLNLPVGGMVQVTGPVSNGFQSVKQVVIMMLGQVCTTEGEIQRVASCAEQGQ